MHMLIIAEMSDNEYLPFNVLPFAQGSSYGLWIFHVT